MRILLALLIGLGLGIALGVQFGGARAILPISSSALTRQIETLLTSMTPEVGDFWRSSLSVHPTPTWRYHVVDGDPPSSGLDTFTGRIIATSSVPPHLVPGNSPGSDLPTASLYFDDGDLYCVETSGGRGRFLLIDGKVRHATFYDWNDTNDAPRVVRTIELDAHGQVIRHTLVSGVGRSDTHYRNGRHAVDVDTAPDGHIRRLNFQKGDHIINVEFTPDGTVRSENEWPGKP